MMAPFDIIRSFEQLNVFCDYVRGLCLYELPQGMLPRVEPERTAVVSLLSCF